MRSHDWDISPAEAIAIQHKLRTHVRIQPPPGPLRTVGGLDVHGDRGAVAVLTWPDLEWLTGTTAERAASFPYLPGLLSFREIPALLAAIEQLDLLPDVLLCDGHGLAHPRRFGLACHLGVLLERSTIGCAKTRLCGRHADVGADRGSSVPLVDGEMIGAVVRTQTAVKPVYVSVGHLVDLESAVEIVLHSASRYRLPEPLRFAHTMAKTGRCPLPRGKD
jgi:deoxyribonuclease V